VKGSLLVVEKVGNRLASNAEGKALAVAGLNNQQAIPEANQSPPSKSSPRTNRADAPERRCGLENSELTSKRPNCFRPSTLAGKLATVVAIKSAKEWKGLQSLAFTSSPPTSPRRLVGAQSKYLVVSHNCLWDNQRPSCRRRWKSSKVCRAVRILGLGCRCRSSLEGGVWLL